MRYKIVKGKEKEFLKFMFSKNDSTVTSLLLYMLGLKMRICLDFKGLAFESTSRLYNYLKQLKDRGIIEYV